jgi:cbb3-type cytochrome oxidase subunit 1
MTPLIRRYIKTSFLFLLSGLVIGAYLVTAQFLLDIYPPRLLMTAHVHLLLVGFLLMIVMGVATWMFPRPARDDTRYRPEVAEAVYWIMTLSTALRAATEIALSLAAPPSLRWLVALGGIGQVVGTALFVANMWWRVRMPPAAAPSGR